MPNAFLQDLAQKAQLSDTELAILTAADVRSAEDVDSLLASFPSLAGVGVRLPDISNSVALLLGSNYTTLAANPSLDAITFALGASPPDDTEIALGMEVPMIATGALAIAGAGASALTAPNIDLRLANWPVRNQGNRGTCVAFGSTACVEHYCSSEGAVGTDLSEEFLYWAIKDHSNDPNKTQDGTWLRYARDMLKSDGVCAESFWAYDGSTVPTPVSGATADDPSDAAKSDAGNREFSASCTESSPRGAAGLICRLLNQNSRPVAGCFPVFKDRVATDGSHGWATRVAKLYGRILNPPPTSVVAGGHCVCVTGFVPDSDEPMGGYFIFRNSWGTDWSNLSPSPINSYAPEQGYGQISATYVNKYCWELMQL